MSIKQQYLAVKGKRLFILTAWIRCGCARSNRRHGTGRRARTQTTPPGSPLWGRRGRGPVTVVRSADIGSVGLGARRHNTRIMSSFVREGFGQAGCAPPLQAACPKATADKAPYQPCRSAATCPKAGAIGRRPKAGRTEHSTRRAGDKNRPDPYLRVDGWAYK